MRGFGLGQQFKQIDLGADKLLKNKKELETEGRGSSDFFVDGNCNGIVVCWLDNNTVQLNSNYIGNAEGSPA